MVIFPSPGPSERRGDLRSFQTTLRNRPNPKKKSVAGGVFRGVNAQHQQKSSSASMRPTASPEPLPPVRHLADLRKSATMSTLDLSLVCNNIANPGAGAFRRAHTTPLHERGAGPVYFIYFLFGGARCSIPPPISTPPPQRAQASS